MNTTEYEKISEVTDESLCARAASGDRAAEEALVLRHTRLVRACARPFFLAGGDSEDLIQEGMVGLLSAIREFRPQRGARFRTFAQVCVRRRIVSVVRAAAAGKHTPLNDSVSLDPSLFLANQDFTSLGTAYHQHRNPEDVVIHEENLSALEDAIYQGLTRLEAQVLEHYLGGLSYAGPPRQWTTLCSGYAGRSHSIYPAANTAKADRIYPAQETWVTKSKRGLQACTKTRR